MPSWFPVIDAKMIKEKTTPEAPNNIMFGENKLWTRPVTMAVEKITIINLLPYFSSSIGPNNKIYSKLDIRWFISLWPKTWVKSRK